MAALDSPSTPDFPTEPEVDAALAAPERLAAVGTARASIQVALAGWDRLTELACVLLAVPCSFVTVVNADHDDYPSHRGLPQTLGTEVLKELAALRYFEDLSQSAETFTHFLDRAKAVHQNNVLNLVRDSLARIDSVVKFSPTLQTIVAPARRVTSATASASPETTTVARALLTAIETRRVSANSGAPGAASTDWKPGKIGRAHV